MASELYDKGMKLRREVLGDEYVDRALQSVDEFTREFQQMVTEHAWGAIWSRPGLPKKQRSLINLDAWRPSIAPRNSNCTSAAH